MAVGLLAVAVVVAAVALLGLAPPSVGVAAGVAAAVGMLVAGAWSMRAARLIRRERREAAGRMAAFQQAAGIGMFEWDLSKPYAVISAEYRSMMGLPASQRRMSKDQWMELIHPDDRDDAVGALMTAIEKDEPYDVEYRVRRPDGSVLWTGSRAVVFRDAEGKPLRVLGAMLDVDARKRAELAVQERERMFRQMADHAPVMIWLSDPDGQITFFSRSCYDFTGRSAADALGRGWLAVVHPDDRDRALSTLLEGIARREPFTSDLRIRRRDGSYRWMINTASPRFENGGTFVGFIGSVVDIQDRKESEERNALLMREVDHRAKNALSVVTSIIRITRADTMEAYAAAVEGRIAAMARAHMLLAAANWRGTPLRRLVEEELEVVGVSLERLTIEGAPVGLCADAVQPLTLVLHELTTNAFKHGALASGSGRLCVAWTIEDSGDLVLRWNETVGRPIHPPARRGFGMELLETLVEKQLHGAIHFHWTGCGLDMRLVIPPGLHGTEAAVVDAVAAVPAEPPPVARRMPSGRRQRVLVVEDDVLIALSLDQMLEDLGYRVMGPAYTVEEAMALLDEERPAAVLLDMNLGGTLSTAVARRLQAEAIPYAYCTGYGHGPEVAGPAPVLLKPFSAVLVERTVEALLAAAEPRCRRSGRP